MANKSDWVSYLIAGFYATILLGCFLGIRKNMLKKTKLVQTNRYEKQKRVIRWRYRFYFTLFTATTVRIACLIAAPLLDHTIVISKADTQSEFIWSFIASLGSCLYLTSFTFIIWFFAHVAFNKQPKYKRLITPFFTGLNVTLYICSFTIGISAIGTSTWRLSYDVQLPLFAICGWILALSFIFLSYKISSSIQRERQDTVEYMEYSRRLSMSQQQHRMNSPLMGSGSNNRGNRREYGGGGDIETSMSKNRYPLPAPLPPQPPHQQQSQAINQDGRSGGGNQIISRLIKLSLLCAFCWIIRGMYLFSIRFWESTDKTPFGIAELSWEAIYYFVTEYPPSLGCLILMISKPKRGRGPHLSMHEAEYPQAKQNEY